MSSISDEAKALHQEGRKAGAAGDTARALELFVQAHQLAPQWPYPPYDMAFTYLLNDDIESAEIWYALVDELEPRGFFTAKTFLAMVRCERRGELPSGFVKAFAMLEWLPEAQQRAMLQRIVVRFPGVAPAWKQLATLTTDEDARLEALDRGLAADPDDETYGMLVLNKALVLRHRGKFQEARWLLENLLADPRCTQAVEALAKMSLEGG
jgi:tetratricopeptide (TPR) repeat protein